jgi:2-dehydro-3-deoxyphosphogluconate aldolase/(4S)-4-hydroxy-2-oxoglutarate aldolase
MTASSIKELIRQEKLVPILRTRSHEAVLPVAECIIDAGCRIIEYTMTIEGVINEIEKVKSKYPELIIGLGTVLDKKDAEAAVDKGVDFIVSPIVNYDIVDAVKSRNKMIMLSGFTPTEIFNAFKAGSDIIKLFPASEIAPTFIQRLKGPFPDLDLFPAGGLDLISAIQYLSYGAIAVGIGNNVFRPDLIKNKNYKEITSLLMNALHRIRNMEI